MSGYEDFVDLVHQCVFNIFFFDALRKSSLRAKNARIVGNLKRRTSFSSAKNSSMARMRRLPAAFEKAIEIQSV
jgi:hypothetical protein